MNKCLAISVAAVFAVLIDLISWGPSCRLSFASTAGWKLQWVPATGGEVPDGALIGGSEPGRALAIRQARSLTGTGTYPGKLIGDHCDIPYDLPKKWQDKVAQSVYQYSILVDSDPASFEWLRSAGSGLPSGAFTASEANRDGVVCRSAVDPPTSLNIRELHLGHIHDTTCVISFVATLNGTPQMVTRSEFDVLRLPAPHVWHHVDTLDRTKPYIPSTAFVGGYGDYQPYVLCRGVVNGKLYPGELSRDECTVASESGVSKLTQFDLLLVAHNATWLPAFGPYRPTIQAFKGGKDSRGPLGVCRTTEGNTEHPGRYLESQGDCAIPYSRFLDFSLQAQKQYQILVEGSYPKELIASIRDIFNSPGVEGLTNVTAQEPELTATSRVIYGDEISGAGATRGYRVGRVAISPGIGEASLVGLFFFSPDYFDDHELHQFVKPLSLAEQETRSVDLILPDNDRYWAKRSRQAVSSRFKSQPSRLKIEIVTIVVGQISQRIALHRDKIEVGSSLRRDYWDTVAFRTILVYLTTDLIGAAVICLVLVSGARANLAPLIVYVAPAIPIYATTLGAYLDIDKRTFAILFFATLVGVVPVFAAVRPLLKAFAGVTPYNFIVGALLQWPRYRRYVYGDYVEYVTGALQRQRREANREFYYPTPAAITFHSSTVSNTPAQTIVQFISTEPAVRIYIESPGGRGKTALLRETVELLVERFCKDGRCPLPVLVSSRNDSIVQALTASLERFAVSRELLNVELQSGLFAVVIDGLTDGGMDPERVRQFCVSEIGAQTPIVVTSRPNEEFRKAFREYSEVVLVEPHRLDDDNVRTFEQHYLRCDPESTPLSSAVRKACRAIDGTYLPILIRFALTVDHSDPKISALYRSVFRQLLRRKSQISDEQALSDAAAYCIETYWQNGRRRLLYAEIKKDDYKVTLTELFNAGILIGAGRGNERDEPTEVVFFHDSMQSYLTALGLLNRDPACGDLGFLKRAAGARIFAEAGSELYGSRGSELFHFCIEVFPADFLVDQMAKDLAAWSDRWGDILSREKILRGTPDFVKKDISDAITDLTPEMLLERVVEGCRSEHDEYLRVTALSSVYAEIAPIVAAHEENSDES